MNIHLITFSPTGGNPTCQRIIMQGFQRRERCYRTLHKTAESVLSQHNSRRPCIYLHARIRWSCTSLSR